ncbi:metallophosphoesterase [Fibrisoma montanum]|uniref:Metallophosphoesterase n=1 Tax=Fibrisoma montanum TaxID=2305895 RepID=A0A418M494_9BACT|nr:metallophosphoesterase [Fibrisoma montanum]RIV20483.1 metallophosphoesterase [Fibrisoma montanum]
MNRRDLLKSAALLPLSTTSEPLAPGLARKRSVRLAYIGDTHVLPESKPMNGIAACLQHIQNQADRPQFILHGGDTIMDALAEGRDKVKAQWDAWHQVVKANSSLPIEYCIGNHDVWGYENAKAEPEYGKKWAVDQMRISGRYRSFDRNGWHFVVLDSVQLKPDGSWYTGNLDPEQMDWLKQDLAKTSARTPVLVLSHIPILTTTVFAFNGQQSNPTTIPAGLMHTDFGDLIKLFYQYPNVKTALSGHTHLLERVDYNGVSYLCNGAVSGNWWKTDTHQQTKAGYALIDLYDDGTVERTYVAYA